MKIKMENFSDYIYKYCLHDTEINDIRFEDKKLVICFEKGIYVFDESKQKTVRTSPCEMKVHLDMADDDEL